MRYVWPALLILMTAYFLVCLIGHASMNRPRKALACALLAILLTHALRSDWPK